MFCFFKQKTAYEMRISDWSSDVCSSDLVAAVPRSELPDDFRCRQERCNRPLPGQRGDEPRARTRFAVSGRLRGAVSRRDDGRYPDRRRRPPFARATGRIHPGPEGTYRTRDGTFSGRQIGRAHVCTPVTNAHLVCRLLLETKNTTHPAQPDTSYN